MSLPERSTNPVAVDYILFLTADVTVAPNPNEIRDHKYVDKAELQAMFEDPGEFWSLSPRCLRAPADCALSANSFTPWFKLIARDFLFGWWDELLARKPAEGIGRTETSGGVVRA